MGLKIDGVSLDDLGSARNIVINERETIIVDGAGDSKEIMDRMQHIKNEIEASSSDYDIEKMQERLAKISGGIAIIRVGAFTEAEIREIKGRIEDALNATRAAIEQGVVPGGGVMLVRASEILEDLDEEDMKPAKNILIKAMREPLFKIASNSGHEPNYVLNKILDLEGQMGFDAKTGEYVDMIKAGIIDPAKVTITALANAVSVAGMMLTASCIIADKKEA